MRKKRTPWTLEQRAAFSAAQKARKGSCKVHHNTCCICSTVFAHKSARVRTCSTECRNKRCSEVSRTHPNCGGETNYKRYVYRDMIFDSSWEVEIAKYLDDHNIKWERSRKHLLYWVDTEGKKRRYYPDFFLPELNLYLDPKNSYKQSKDKEKIEYIQKHHTLVVGSVGHIISTIGTCLQ